MNFTDEKDYIMRMIKEMVRVLFSLALQVLLVYENRTDGIVVEWKKTVHFPPHLHEAIEVVYVTDGDIELGVGQELYHMDEGDFAIVFPNVIHHYQVFGKKENKVIYLYLDPTLFPSYYKELQIYSPKNPVVKKEQVHPDVVNAIKYLAGVIVSALFHKKLVTWD